MKIIHFIFLLCIGIVFVLTRCSRDPVSPQVRALTVAEKNLVASDNKFGLKLFREIVDHERDKNVFVSPLSISIALGMTLNGAEGETREAMEQTLDLAGLDRVQINHSYRSLMDLLGQLDPDVAFKIANSIWYRQEMTFEQPFLNVNKTFFDATVQAVDFSDPNTIGLINNWVAQHTSGKIEEIIDRIDPSIVMFLINAIYFNGTWTYEFDKELTRDDFFALPDGSQKACRMMIQTGEFDYFENEEFQAIDLPYGNRLFSMTIFLPKAGQDINSFISALDDESLNQWLNRFSPDSVTIELPKFKLEYEIKLNDVLTALGMGIAFTPAADFTGMFRPGGIYIDYVKHKSFVEVDEEGTEAAGVTVVAIIRGSTGSRVKFMRADRPFVFVIRENHSQTVLFIGKNVEP